jgi:hypothetical protein
MNVNHVPSFFTPREKEMDIYLIPVHSEQESSFGHLNEKKQSSEER